ncbi:RluA family pseudouridine synthase [Paenibacillus arenilitoris]|uniref:Pseudouridine synthase n=1 Tax=Paenibacillus arenilitoris TaxID=2772299 RepID=A0A927H3U0_9BACL|nr:RluA family pseudouridine synthase [Paenibacillus arenilitoris]MBD2867706.1 RluA family pseudouridine synthase [Paenibacillus arenilitoris]
MPKGKKRPARREPAVKNDKSKSYPVTEAAELLPFLIRNVAGAGRNAVKSMLARGQVAVDGKGTIAYNLQLRPGQTVTVSKEGPKEKLPFQGLSILFEDEHLLVVRKDAGLLSIASAAGKDDELTAYRQLMAHVKLDNPNNRVFIVHRLDRDTSGVMLFAKSEAVQQLLQNNWRESMRERSYVALVEGTVKKEQGTIASWLKESKTLKMYSSPYPNDGQHAVTHYKVLRASKSFSLLEVRLETGRKNQIRVHMEDIGHPIVGDKKYGARTRSIGRLGLHARVLAFEHPITGEPMRFETDVPKPFLRPFQAEE